MPGPGGSGTRRPGVARAGWRGAVGLIGLLLLGLAGVAPGLQAAAGEIPDQQALLQLGVQLLGFMRQGDVEGVIALLDQGVVLLDEEMPREEAIQRLRDPQSLEYGYLFDSQAYRAAIVRQRRASGLSERQYQSFPPIASYRAVRDHLLGAHQVRTQTEPIRSAGGTAPTVALVTYDWPDRPDVASVGQCGFVLRPKGWKLYSPFSFYAWGIHP